MAETRIRTRPHDTVLAVAQELDGAGKAVIVTDASGTITFWNQGAEELYGWLADDVLGRHVLGVTPTNLSMGEGARIMSLLQSGSVWSGSFGVRTRGGEEVLVDVLDIPVRGERAELLGIVGVSRRAGSRAG